MRAQRTRNRWKPAMAAAALMCVLAWSAPAMLAQKAATAATGPLATVRDIARSPLPQGERIVVTFSDEIAYAGDRVGNPDRVYFDFKHSTMPTTLAATARSLGAGPLVASVRIARHTEQSTRLVLDLTGSPRFSVFPLYNPYRLVIDVESPVAPVPAVRDIAPPPANLPAAKMVTQPGPSLAAPAPPSVEAASAPLPPAVADAAPIRERTRPILLTSPAPASTMLKGDYSLARQLGLRVSRIVIDPGHGGHDPGAQSNGINESELVLDVALRLQKLLQNQPGVDVVLTRSTDEFIPLEERTAIANREGADLFLSIHANASRQPVARGVETYFLNFATNPAAEAVAARENATSSRTMGNLPELVKTIALNSKVVESHELAAIVQTSMMRRLRAQNSTLRDLGVKQAPFVVLIGAQMPSVLAEISFVTNKPEASLLKQSSYRQRIAQALFDGVVKYQGSLKSAATVATKAERQ